MCGISGIVNKNNKIVLKDSIFLMNEKLKRRGPDDSGIFLDKGLGFGHTRLSIIDLSPTGHQPMTDSNNNYCLVYNGEIYNYQRIREDLISKGYQFRGTSDSEVLLYSYIEFGEECVKLFNGMFAFAIYDKQNNKVFLARDQFGIKPLYYYSDETKFIFSSNIEALFTQEIEKIPNDKIIYEFLSYNLTAHSSETFYKNIFSLEPGFYLTLDLSKYESKISRWYEFKKVELKSEEELKKLYIDAINLRTIADVPVGSCLSGGVDSSSVVCILDKELNYKIHTFSFVAPGSEIDESEHIQTIIKNTNTIPSYVQLEEDYFLETLDDYIYALEEPVTGLSAYAQYLVFKLVKDNNIKVVLDGQGGDEIFAGYEYYFAYYFYELLSNWNLLSLTSEIYHYYKNFNNTFAIQMFAFLLMPEFFKPYFYRKIVNSWINVDNLIEAAGKVNELRWNKMNLKDSLFLTLFKTSIPHNVLWEDKLSMHFGIESRVPILDYRLAETVLNLESNKLISKGITKLILKNLLRGIVPDSILDRKDKIGFAAPVEDFLRKEKISKYFTSIIESDSFTARPYWKTKEVKKMYYDHLAGKKNCGDTIWKWIHLELWLRNLERAK